MSKIRVHQHVNPLSPFYCLPPKPLAIEKLFVNPELPLHLDIGCARGRFLLKMAQMFPAQNYLGVEIREPLVDEANRIAKENNLTNLHYEFNNATHSLNQLLADLPAVLQTVTIQFPDPWFKKKHAKRRMVKDNLVETVVSLLQSGGQIFLQTDIEFLAAEMFVIFRENANLREHTIAENPFPVKTERETAVEEKGFPVYRRLFEKT